MSLDAQAIQAKILISVDHLKKALLELELVGPCEGRDVLEICRAVGGEIAFRGAVYRRNADFLEQQQEKLHVPNLP